SENAEKSIRALEARLAYNCTRCKYFGSCDGYPIAEDHSNCREVSPEGIRVCVLEKSLFGHIERRIREAGLVDDAGRLNVGPDEARRLGMREGRQQSEVFCPPRPPPHEPCPTLAALPPAGHHRLQPAVPLLPRAPLAGVLPDDVPGGAAAHLHI